MSITSFFRSFRTSTPEEDLPLSARVTTLEDDMLEMRAHSDRMFTTVRKLQGKVYRGVSLGDTKDQNLEEAPPGPNEVMGMSPTKTELYQRAAELRRH